MAVLQFTLYIIIERGGIRGGFVKLLVVDELGGRSRGEISEIG